LCYDRLKGGLEPACAKACPTDSIQFSEVGELQQRAHQRVSELHELGVASAYLYGVPNSPGATGDLGHLNAFFLLTAEPEAYNLPAAPSRASNRVGPSLSFGLAAAAGLTLAAAALFGWQK
jgi:formate dehydrogenase iron-sulfur subunit